MGLLDRSGSTAMEVILNRPAYFPGDELLAFLAFQPTPADSSCRGRSILWVTAQVYGRVDLHADWQFLVRGNEVLPPTSTGPRRLSTSVVDTGSSNHQQRCISQQEPVSWDQRFPVTNHILLFTKYKFLKRERVEMSCLRHIRCVIPSVPQPIFLTAPRRRNIYPIPSDFPIFWPSHSNSLPTTSHKYSKCHFLFCLLVQ